MPLQSILLVDDDDSIRRIAELTLTALGNFVVSVAKSGQEALAMLEEIRPDMIILDVMMPGMDGPTVFSVIKKNPATASIPVVFMTAKIQKHEMEGYSGLGLNGIITKPFEPDELPDILRKIYASAMAGAEKSGAESKTLAPR